VKGKSGAGGKGRREAGEGGEGAAGKGVGTWEGRAAVRQLRDRSKLVPLTEQRRRQLELELELAAQRNRKRLRQGGSASERRPSSAAGGSAAAAAAAAPSRRSGWARGGGGWGSRPYLSDEDVMDAEEEAGLGWQGIGSLFGGGSADAPWPPHPLLPATPLQQPFGAAAPLRGAPGGAGGMQQQPPGSALRGGQPPSAWAGAAGGSRWARKWKRAWLYVALCGSAQLMAFAANIGTAPLPASDSVLPKRILTTMYPYIFE
ncbi:hypothetical protein DUNSADRAFT_13124, partial [Dunaliella salina]